MKSPALFVLLLPLFSVAPAAPIQPVPYVVSPSVASAVRFAEPSAVRMDGWLGARIDASISHRLMVVDTEPLLAGYRQKPGEQAWIGEHVGKWLHAATLAWAYTGDAALRHKLDGVVTALIATQEPDGYLGTYVPAKRFGIFDNADWDVWNHKYNLIGLLTYYRYTGDPAALAASRKIGDLLIATFPAKRSIVLAGQHQGLAATSVLGPVVELYRLTGDARYLDFARYIIRAYEDPEGPDLVRALLAPGASVNRIANGKAYEMISNLVGLGEYYGVTGDQRIRQALEVAWSDITRNRLYLTGTASIRELFGSDHELSNEVEAHLGETCVTTTWIQFNAVLLAQTGEAKYADEIERSLYNQLTAAQNPRGDDWCYYTALQGLKQYDKGISCCHSSGPRGLALAPTFAYLEDGTALYVNSLETSRAKLHIAGHEVELAQASKFPFAGESVLTVRTPAPVRFALKVRVPAWAAPMKTGDTTSGTGWLTLSEREWHDGDQVVLSFNLSGRLIRGDYTNYSRVAYGYGPYVLALDEKLNPEFGGYDAPQFIHVFNDQPPVLLADHSRIALQITARGEWDTAAHPLKLVPFAEAGVTGGHYSVWLRAP